MGSLTVFFVATLLALTQACQPPDCDHPDCGSCANACCTLMFGFDMDPDQIHMELVKSLKKGGADGRYTFINDTDYRPDNISVQYQLQAKHSTLVHHYNDTLDFLIMKGEGGNKSMLKGFSISRIEGAYCDAGQNYKNLVGLVKGFVKDEKLEPKLLYGCNMKPPAV